MLRRLLDRASAALGRSPAAADPPAPPRKRYRLSVPAEQMRDLVPHRLGAIATDRVTVDGRPVGYMRRTEPVDPADSGWEFLAGDEDGAFMDDPGNHGVFAVNTIANHDPAILPYLDAPVGSVFYRSGDRFVRDAPAAMRAED